MKYTVTINHNIKKVSRLCYKIGNLFIHVSAVIIYSIRAFVSDDRFLFVLIVIQNKSMCEELAHKMSRQVT